MKPARHILIFAVRVYRALVSPVLTTLFTPLGFGCRFTPTCSQYALEALQQHGALRGSWLATKRLCRCQPWGGCGHDPVPPVFQFQISSFKFWSVKNSAPAARLAASGSSISTLNSSGHGS